MAIPNNVDSQLAGFLKGHLVDLFVGKTWFSLALIIQPGRFAGINFFNHTHPQHMDAEDLNDENLLRHTPLPSRLQ